MFGFNKKPARFAEVPKREFGPTKKLKNTYVITFDTMMDERVWGACPTSKLAVKKIDGEVVAKDGGWNTLTEFPNPFAYRMVCAYNKLATVMGKELAGTIVVYGDKKNREDACVILFPTNEVAVYGPDAMSRLNHASRRDLKHQMAKRQKYIDMLNQNCR
ncbi:MAG: hypothetical protein KBS86_00260 [Proteobacteria bacterium]|nr:hypothetical protein [Candidatus Enterousia scatequi]